MASCPRYTVTSTRRTSLVAPPRQLRANFFSSRIRKGPVTITPPPSTSCASVRRRCPSVRRHLTPPRDAVGRTIPAHSAQLGDVGHGARRRTYVAKKVLVFADVRLATSGRSWQVRVALHGTCVCVCARFSCGGGGGAAPIPEEVWGHRMLFVVRSASRWLTSGSAGRVRLSVV